MTYNAEIILYWYMIASMATQPAFLAVYNSQVFCSKVVS